MLTSVRFLSRSAAVDLPAMPAAAMISIQNVGEPPVILSQFHSVLRLSFEDMAEDWLSIPVGVLPDRTRDGSPLCWQGSQLPMADDAQRIVSFIQALARLDIALDLIVHCHAGISRSAAVALFVANWFNVPFAMDKVDTSGANPRLSRLLLKVANNHTLIEHDTAPNVARVREEWLKSAQR